MFRHFEKDPKVSRQLVNNFLSNPKCKEKRTKNNFKVWRNTSSNIFPNIVFSHIDSYSMELREFIFSFWMNVFQLVRCGSLMSYQKRMWKKINKIGSFVWWRSKFIVFELIKSRIISNKSLHTAQNYLVSLWVIFLSFASDFVILDFVSAIQIPQWIVKIHAYSYPYSFRANGYIWTTTCRLIFIFTFT